MQNTQRTPTNQYEKDTQPNLETGLTSPREYATGQQAYKNVFHIISHQGNAI